MPRTDDEIGRPVAFLLSPRSSNDCQIDRQMYELPRFRAVFEQCDAVVRDELGWSLLEGLTFDGQSYRRKVTEAEFEPVVLALQIAAAEVWRDRGVQPAAVAGASGGEYAAAFVAGALSLEDAMRVACCTGVALGSRVGVGAMIAVSMKRDDAEAYLATAPETVYLAAQYSHANVALSGEAAAIDAVSADLTRRQIRWRPIQTGRAVHSLLMDPHEVLFVERLGRLRPRAPQIPIYSAAAGGLVDEAPLDARHWWCVFRQPAYLADAAKAMLRDGFATFVEFGLHPVISSAVREAATISGAKIEVLMSGMAAGGPDLGQRTTSEGSVESAPASAFDPASPDVRRDPYPHYHRLRAQSPVQFLPRAGFWAILGHAEAIGVLRDPAVFSSSILRGFDAVLIGADPPGHTRVRQLLTEAFSQTRMGKLEAHIRARTGLLLDGVANLKAFDVVSAIATPLPVSVIAGLLGMEGEELERLKQWSDAMVMGASGRPGPEERTRIMAAGAEMERFLAGHVARLRSAPDGSLLGDLVGSVDGQSPLTGQEAASLARLLLIAGNETTTNLIGNTLLALLRTPAELARLQADRTLVMAAIEETLRYDAPVQTIDRVTTRSVEVAGVAIPAQARVGVMLGAANRDPAVFPDPDRFNIARDPHGHLAFGGGPHYCLGAFLSRLETRVVIEGVLDRLPHVRAAQPLDDVELTRSMHLRGPYRLMLAGPSA